MKKLFLMLFFYFMTLSKAMANPACVVCTVAIGASLEIARKLGICDEVVGLWAGAFLAILGYWTILWFEKKHWDFWGRDFLLLWLSVAMIGFVYVGELSYHPQIVGFLYVDTFLLAAVVGALSYILSQKFYLYLKLKNGGKAHFPFEKVVLPLAVLLFLSGLINSYPL